MPKTVPKIRVLVKTAPKKAIAEPPERSPQKPAKKNAQPPPLDPPSQPADQASTRKRRLNGEGNYTLMKDGSWRYRVTIHGKLKDFRGKTKAECKKKYEAFLELKEAQKEARKSPDISSTVAEKAIWWCKNVKAIQIQGPSYDRVVCTVLNQIIPYLGEYRFDELTAPEIQTQLINQLNKEGASYSQIKKAKEAIHGIYQYSVATRELKFNPVDAVELPGTKVRKPPAKVIPLTAEEVVRLKEVCTAKYSNGNPIIALGYGILFILYTGIRLGEALGLKWSDIDLQKRTLTISHTLIMTADRSMDEDESLLSGKKVAKIKKGAKSAAGERVIPLCDHAINALLELQKIRYFGENSFVFSSKNGSHFKQSRSFCKTFDTVLTRANIPHLPHRGVHTLRHTFATAQFRAGIDVKYVSAWLGHASVDVTYDIYIDVINETKGYTNSNNVTVINF